nr:tripartite tricarboxylate transporter TctB family protein [uncultured Mediterraneibacter sp.]
MGNMKKANYIISAIMFLVGIGIVARASSLKIKLGEGDPGAGFWPMLLGALIIVFSAVLLISTIKNKKKLEEKTFTISTPANIRVYILFGVIILFCVILYFLGFYVGILLFIPTVMYLLEVRSVKRIVLTTVITLVAIYVLFGMLLNITLPAPVFFR